MAKIYRITSRARDGFRRGGRRHPTGKSEYPEDSFSDCQIPIIERDPAFTVEIIEVDGKPERNQEPSKPADPEPAMDILQPASRQDRIILAIQGLGDGDFLKDGSPRVKAVETAMGDQTVTKEEVTAIWAAMQETAAG